MSPRRHYLVCREVRDAYPLDGGARMHGAGRLGRMATTCAARPKFWAGRPAGRRGGECPGVFLACWVQRMRLRNWWQSNRRQGIADLRPAVV